MRVALELQPCCGKRTGIGMYTYEIAKRMRDREGLEFSGNLFNFWGRNDNAEALQGIKMPICESRMFPYGVYRRIWNVIPIPYQRLFPQRADLTLFFNYIVPPHVDGKVITTVYDMTYMRCPETMEQKNLRRIERGIQYSVARSDHIVTISEFSKRELVQLLGVPDQKVSVVYSAPTASGATVDHVAVLERLRILKPYILYVGTIEPRKNLARLIKAFDRLKKVHGIPHQLVLAGGNGWKSEGIYYAVDKASAKAAVRFTGYVTQAEKNALYQNADVFCFPSLYEGFGMPPLEAMVAGCPVVCANAASLPEVMGDAARLVDPMDEADIAEGLWQVLSDGAYAAALIQKGYAQNKKFTWDASARRLTEICKMVVGER